MKHRVLLKRAMAFVLTVTMLTSMCTTGYAADVGGSMEVQGTDGTSGAGMLYDSDEDEGVRRGGDSEAQDDQKSEAQDNENDKKKVNDNTDEDTGKNSDGQDEKTGEAEDTSGKESGENQSRDSDNQKPSQGDSNDSTEDADGNSGDESKNQDGNSGDKNQAPEEGSGDQTQTSGSNSDDKSQDSGANQGDPKDTEGSTDGADTNQGDNQGTVSNPETDTNGSLNDKKNPDKTQNNTGANTDKTQDGKDEDRVIVSPEEFLTEYEAFLEKYKADQENISKGKKPVEFKTWKEVKASIARILDMADGLEDPDPMEEQIQELREIFTNEGSKEFVRLVVRLMNDLINGEDEELPENEELEAIILDGPANEFSQLIDELIQDMSEKSEDEEANRDETGKDGSLDDSLGTGTDGAGAEKDAEERGQATSAENVDSDGKNVLESADKAATAENDTKTAENTDDEELDEELTSGPVAEFFQDVNNLIYDMVVVLADEETALSGKELREALSKSRVIADFVLGVSGVLQEIKDGMDIPLVYDIERPVDEAVLAFIEGMRTITNDVIAGEYVSQNTVMLKVFSKEREKLPTSITSGLNDFAVGFRDLLWQHNIMKTNQQNDTYEEILERVAEQETRLQELMAQAAEVDEFKNGDLLDDITTGILGLYEEDLDAVSEAQAQKVEEQGKAVKSFVTQLDEITVRILKGYYVSDSAEMNRSFLEAREKLKESAPDILEQFPSRNHFQSFIDEFYVLINNYNAQVKLSRHNQETIYEEVVNQQNQQLGNVRSRASEAEALRGCLDDVEAILQKYANDLAEILKDQKREQIPKLDTQTDEMVRRFDEKSYVTLESFKEELEQVRLAVKNISEDPEIKPLNEELQAKLDAIPGKLDELENKINDRIAKREKLTKEYDEWVSKAQEFLNQTEALAPGDGDKEPWQKLIEDIVAFYEKLELAEAEEFLFSTEQFNNLRNTLDTLLREIAWKEYKTKANDINEKYEEQTLEELIQKLRDIKDIQSMYLNELGEDKEEEFKQIETELLKTRAKAFTRIATKLKEAAEDGKYKKYEKTVDGTLKTYEGYAAYNEFVSDVTMAKSLLDNRVLNDLEGLLNSLDSGSEEYQEISEIVEEARKNLDTLEKCKETFSETTKPEAQEAMRRFKSEYEAFIAGYSTLDWDTLLKRVKELQKLVNDLPKELYVQTETEQKELLNILSNKAKEEVQKVIAEVKPWFENPAESEASVKDIRRKLDFANELMDYINSDKQDILESLEFFAQKLQLIQNGNTSKNIEDFLNGVAAFVQMAENKSFVDKNGRVHAYELLAEYNKLQTYYDVLNEAEKDHVKEEKKLLDEIWDEICKEYEKDLAMMQGSLYEFLSAVEELYYGYFEEVRGGYNEIINKETDDNYTEVIKQSEIKEYLENHLWNLKFSYEECLELKKKVEEDCSASGSGSGDTSSGNDSGNTGEGSNTEEGGSTGEGGNTEEGGSTEEGGNTEKGGSTEEGGNIGKGGSTEEGSNTEEGGDTEEGGNASGSDNTENGDSFDNGGGSEASNVPTISDLEENADYIKAVEELDEIGKWIQGIEIPSDFSKETPVGGLYIVGQALNTGDVLSVPEVTMYNAREFIHLISEMESGLSEMHTMCQRMEELVTQLYNGTSTEADRQFVAAEIEQLVFEIDKVAKHTDYDNWHGLVGGKAYAETAWKNTEGEENEKPEGIDNPMSIEISPMTAKGLGLDEVYQSIVRDEIDEASHKLKEVITNISLTRAELGARQNLSEHIVTAMETWMENGDGSSSVVEFDSISKDNRYDEINDRSVIRDSYNNARKMITNIQVFEGVLTEQHDMLQRMNELAVKRFFYEEGGTDYQSITLEMKALAEGLTFLSEYVNYDNCNALIGGKVDVPMGWNDYQCHPVQIKLFDMRAEGLGLPPEGEFSIEAINEAIVTASKNRSHLGAWQNTAEHIVELCQITLETGPIVGNQFDRYPDGYDPTWDWYDHHHTPVKLTGWFDRVYREVHDRIDELNIKKANSSLTELECGFINEEIRQLNYGIDVMIDLLKTDMGTVPFVRLESDEDWKNEVLIRENRTDYRYKLDYKSDASAVTNVCLIDHVENGDNSAYAGVIKGVNLDGVKDTEEKAIPVTVYVRTRGRKESIAPVPVGDLPEALKKEGGEWERIDVANYENWPNVEYIAFDFGNHAFGINEPTISVEIEMSSIYGGNPACPAYPAGNIIPPKDEEYTLYNTCKVYQKTAGDLENAELVAVYAGIDTAVTIKYEDFPVELPTTGGSGTLPFRIAGLAFLVLAETMMFFKREEDDEMLRGIRG